MIPIDYNKFLGKDLGDVDFNNLNCFEITEFACHYLQGGKKLDTNAFQYSITDIKIFSSKAEFYSEYPKLVENFLSIGLSNDTSNLIASSLGEVIDNSFSHNLGQWPSELGPTVIML